MNESVDTGEEKPTTSRSGYWIYEWEEECSQFTPGARWVGTEYRAVTCRMWIPDSVTSDDDIERYVEQHSDDPDAYCRKHAERAAKRWSIPVPKKEVPNGERSSGGS